MAALSMGSMIVLRWMSANAGLLVPPPVKNALESIE
jgi:hypothetical protein